ncbi:methyltransferase domain-containing protein [Streptomyces tanashiensis]|uniref:methyltransferase domain-containing protein n=1 Tax=Streptomyces tanashiensis TaxID=67367 RepID=UPI0036E4E762
MSPPGRTPPPSRRRLHRRSAAAHAPPTTVFTAPPEQCEMCEEVRLAGAFATGDPYPPAAPGTGFSRLITRTAAIDVLSGLGSLRPGYLLVVPRRHTASLGELPPAELAEAFDLAWRYADRVGRELGSPTVLVEHGSSAVAAAGHSTGHAAAHPSRGSCIIHSHLHVFPLSDESQAALFAAPGSRRTTGLSDLVDTAQRKRNYYFCTWKRDEGYLLSDPNLPSQYARRVWAGTLDEPDLWDWAAFPFLTHCQETADHLRGTEDDQDETERRLRETLLAYGAAARSYAAGTQHYGADSSLPGEIADLAAATAGTVLDAGAGAGRDALCFARTGRPVIALDACLPLLSMIPDDPRVHRVAGDVRAVPVEAGAVGAVWCSAVLLHLPPAELLRALVEFHRVLAGRGALHVSVKEGEGHASLPMGGGNPFRRHFFYYRHEDLVPLARKAGFEVERSWSTQEHDSSAELQQWRKLRLRRTT